MFFSTIILLSSLDQDTLLSFKQTHQIPSILDLYIPSICNGYQQSINSTNSKPSSNIQPSSNSTNNQSIMTTLSNTFLSSSPSSSTTSTIPTLTTIIATTATMSTISDSSINTTSTNQQPARRRRSVNQYYENNEHFRSSTTGSSVHSKETDGDRDSVFGGNNSNNKDSEKDEYISISRYNADKLNDNVPLFDVRIISFLHKVLLILRLNLSFYFL